MAIYIDKVSQYWCFPKNGDTKTTIIITIFTTALAVGKQALQTHSKSASSMPALYLFHHSQ